VESGKTLTRTRLALEAQRQPQLATIDDVDDTVCMDTTDEAVDDNHTDTRNVSRVSKASVWTISTAASEADLDCHSEDEAQQRFSKEIIESLSKISHLIQADSNSKGKSDISLAYRRVLASINLQQKPARDDMKVAMKQKSVDSCANGFRQCLAVQRHAKSGAQSRASSRHHGKP
jgi:hypothetical protein